MSDEHLRRIERTVSEYNDNSSERAKLLREKARVGKAWRTGYLTVEDDGHHLIAWFPPSHRGHLRYGLPVPFDRLIPGPQNARYICRNIAFADKLALSILDRANSNQPGLIVTLDAQGQTEHQIHPHGTTAVNRDGLLRAVQPQGPNEEPLDELHLSGVEPTIGYGLYGGHVASIHHLQEGLLELRMQEQEMYNTTRQLYVQDNTITEVEQGHPLNYQWNSRTHELLLPLTSRLLQAEPIVDNLQDLARAYTPEHGLVLHEIPVHFLEALVRAADEKMYKHLIK